MLKFINGTHTVELEREGIEAIAQTVILGKLEESKDISPLLRSSLKSVADMLLSFSGIKAPKGEDKLAFLTAYIIKLGLDRLEEEPFPVSFNVIDNRVKEVQENDAS